MSRTNFEIVGGRRFMLCVGCGLMSSILVWFGKIDSAGYVTLTLGTVGAYITAGAWEARGVAKAQAEGAEQ